MRMMRCQRGLAALEFALLLPLLLLLFLGTAEMARFMILQQKLDKIAYAMADFVTQGDTVSRADLNRFTAAIPQIMSPFPAPVIPVVFTYVSYSDTSPTPCQGVTAPCVVWKYAPVAGGRSVTGSPGGVTALPGGMQPQFRQRYLAAEITYAYRPVLPYTGRLISTLRPQDIYRYAVFKPRTSTLGTLN